MSMENERRLGPPHPEHRLLERFPHHVLYPSLGVAIGLLVPIGAFIMRLIHADPLLVRIWIWSELEYNSDFYFYMTGVSVVTFLAFGWALGNRSEHQRVHNQDLKRRVDDLHLKSVTDGLTGAYTHAYLQETLSIEMERSRRTGHPLSVLLLDIDDFKKINDTYGHLFGDQVLRDVTETLSRSIRNEDILGRYGGEEFLVIMPGADEETADRAGERLRDAVARTGIVNEYAAEKTPVKVTLSIGAATLQPGKAHTPKALLMRADQNLYRAKAGGKNKVYSAASRSAAD